MIAGIEAEALLADKGYDCDELREFAGHQGMKPHVPPRKNRLEERIYDVEIYKERHKVECLFGFLKHYRRLFARFEKLKKRFESFLHFAAAIQWMK